MSIKVRYNDRTIGTVARVTMIAALAGIAVSAATVAGQIDFDVTVPFLVLTAFCAVMAIAYHRGTPVELDISPHGITKHQALGMGWHVDWASVDEVVIVPLKRPMLAVISPSLPSRRGPTEWPIRHADVPANTHAVPASVEIIESVAHHYPRPIRTLPKPGERAA